MGWFKKQHNRVGLSPTKLEELQIKLSAKLGDFGGDLPGRVLRYLTDGEDDTVLTDLAVKKDAAQALGLNCAYHGGFNIHRQGADWHDFLESIEPVDPQFYLRLGKVFEAAAKSLPADRFFCEPWFEGALWLEVLLQEATRIVANVYSSVQRKTAISASLIEAMLAADGRSIQPFLTAPFRAPAAKHRWNPNRMRMMVLSVTGLGETFAKHRDLLASFLVEGSTENRLVALENLVQTKTPAEPFVSELVTCATASSKQLRELAEPLLKTTLPLSRPHLEAIARSGDRTSREHAVRLLGRLYQGAAVEFLKSLESSEKSRPIQEAISAALAETQPEAGISANEYLAPPPRKPLPLNPPVTPNLRDHRAISGRIQRVCRRARPASQTTASEKAIHLSTARVGTVETKICR